METVITLLTTLQSLSPLAVIGLLSVIIYVLLKGKQEVTTLKSNDLHELPAMAEDLREIVKVLQRLELRMVEEFTYLRATMNKGERSDIR